VQDYQLKKILFQKILRILRLNELQGAGILVQVAVQNPDSRLGIPVQNRLADFPVIVPAAFRDFTDDAQQTEAFDVLKIMQHVGEAVVPADRGEGDTVKFIVQIQRNRFLSGLALCS